MAESGRADPETRMIRTVVRRTVGVAAVATVVALAVIAYVGWTDLALHATTGPHEDGFVPRHIAMLALLGLLIVASSTVVVATVVRNLRRMSAQEAELRRRVEESEAARAALEEKSREMSELAAALEQARAEAVAARRVADRANAAKSEFLARMSHELRTPLNAILGFSEIIRDPIRGLEDVDLYRQYAGDIHDSGSHLLLLINDILDLAKVEAGRFELAEELVAPVEVIRRVVRLMKQTATQRGVEVRVEASPDTPLVRGDERVMRQMLFNLLSNSVKFTDPGNAVRLITEREGDGLSLVVADEGIGIGKHDLAVAMQPFGQVSGGLDRSRNGTGLGLPLTKSLIELHGGRFEIESTPGVGTRVTLWFPPERVVEPEQGDLRRTG